MEAWRARLAEGDSEAAWALFVDRYRPLILSTIRRTVGTTAGVMDGFAHVCGQLSANDLARLERYEDQTAPRARFSTWLVAVVHNLAVDWRRSRDGRRRLATPFELSGIQERIFHHVFVEKQSHAETYETVCSAHRGELAFGAFLKELAEVYRVVERARPNGAMYYLAPTGDPGQVTSGTGESRVARAEIRARLDEALAALPPDESLAVRLYVVEGLPAADVARTLGWPNAKTVYNRVYRALGRLRPILDGLGIGPEDL